MTAIMYYVIITYVLSATALSSGFIIGKDTYTDTSESVDEHTTNSTGTEDGSLSWFDDNLNAANLRKQFCMSRPESVWCQPFTPQSATGSTAKTVTDSENTPLAVAVETEIDRIHHSGTSPSPNDNNKTTIIPSSVREDRQDFEKSAENDREESSKDRTFADSIPTAGDVAESFIQVDGLDPETIITTIGSAKTPAYYTTVDRAGNLFATSENPEIAEHQIASQDAVSFDTGATTLSVIKSETSTLKVLPTVENPMENITVPVRSENTTDENESAEPVTAQNPYDRETIPDGHTKNVTVRHTTPVAFKTDKLRKNTTDNALKISSVTDGPTVKKTPEHVTAGTTAKVSTMATTVPTALQTGKDEYDDFQNLLYTVLNELRQFCKELYTSGALSYTNYNQSSENSDNWET